ncbi:hypothetical protein KDA_21100 [Dictyobacter alpinus]|uniref:Uncharacterized protein n=1 Tax=Dictyobacter alpinus TaxID=2014873 RepID=A0A402B5K2_9CHLR|nr:hypothetical protein KDA_21100 [Dictyobacter alpinus]
MLVYTLTIEVGSGKQYNGKNIPLAIGCFDKEDLITYEHDTGDSGTVSVATC